METWRATEHIAHFKKKGKIKNDDTVLKLLFKTYVRYLRSINRFKGCLGRSLKHCKFD